MVLKKMLLTIVIFCTIANARSQSFQNPILAGYYPDPGICRAGVSRGLFAPSITFHKGSFYIVCTEVRLK